MKKFIVLLLSLCIVGTVYPFYMSTGSWEQKKCEICGKPVSVYSEPSFGDSMGIWRGKGKCYWDNEAVFLNNYQSIRCCSECYEKYNKELSALIDNWLKEKQNQHKDIRKQYEAEQLQEKKKEIQSEIKILEDRLGFLELEKATESTTVTIPDDWPSVEDSIYEER